MPTKRLKKQNKEEVIARNRKNFKISADVIASTVASLNEEETSALRWLAEYCRSLDLNRTQMSNLIKQKNGKFYSFDSIYQTFTGRRQESGTSITPIIEAIENFRELETERDRLVKSGFILTRLSTEIWKRCDKARLRQRISYIIGESQIGKTSALKEYQRRNNHGQTIYLETPSGGAKSALLRALALQLGISTTIRHDELGDRIIKSFDHSMLLIVDEAHRCLKSVTGVKSMDFIRQLYNQAECGIVISMTNEGKKALLSGTFAGELKQIWKRRIQPLQLPDIPPQDDLDLFSAAYGLEPASDTSITIEVELTNSEGRSRKKTYTDTSLELQTKVITSEGLGVWIMILQDASDIAQELNREITWGAVIKAYCNAQAEAEIIH